MIVETEPADMLMIRFKLYFNQQRPDPEDPLVFAYFEKNGLVARRELHEEHDGIPYKVLHFGQCYLGRHVGPLGDLYKCGVEHTVLAQHIDELLGNADEPAVQTAVAALDAEGLWEVAMTLAQQLHETARFEPTDDNQLRAEIDATAIHDAFIALPASRSTSTA